MTTTAELRERLEAAIELLAARDVSVSRLDAIAMAWWAWAERVRGE